MRLRNTVDKSGQQNQTKQTFLFGIVLLVYLFSVMILHKKRLYLCFLKETCLEYLIVMIIECRSLPFLKTNP